MSAAWTWIIVGSAATVVLILVAVRARVRKRSVRSARTKLDITMEYRRSEIYASRLENSLKELIEKWQNDLIYDDVAVTRVIKGAIKKGLVMFNPPNEMIQGHKERVEVRIARSTDLREALISGLRGPGNPQFEEIDTSLYMEAKLSGPAFEITSHSPPEQLIVPTPARWEFDVLPCRTGHQTITLAVSMRIEAKGIVGGRRGVSVLEKQIDIRVNVNFATRRFVSNNWQWLIPALLALAGTVAAWLVVPF